MSRAFSNNNSSFNISSSFNVTTTNNYSIADDDRSKILDWLSPLEPRARHQDIEARRVDGVGGWVLQTKEFTRWYNGCGNDESDRAILFCYGDPGVGKSHLTSLVIETLCEWRRNQNIVVTGFYFDFAAREVQSPANMLGSLLKQLLGGLKSFPEEIVQEFHDQKKNLGGRGLQPPEIVHLFQSISSTQRNFICIDAIDECVPAHRLEVLSSLGRLLRTSPNTRIFMTGRSHIRDEIERPLGLIVASLSIKPTQDDIIMYLQARLSKDTTPEVMDSRLRAEIIKSVPETNPETFLLVSLHIEAILRETTISRRRRRLEAMTDGLGLDDAYRATLERINAQGEEKAKLAMATLMWICHSERPLEVGELCHALAVEIGSKDFDPDNVPLINTLLSCCQGLIAVDREASIVRLIHFTLQEYLSSHPDLFPRAHSEMLEVCLTYLSSRQVKDLSPKSINNLQSTPFLQYSSRYWGTHAKKELSDNGKHLALELLDQYENHIAAESLFQQVEHQILSSDIVAPSLFTALHCACFFGIDEVVKALIERKEYDINRTDRVGATPLRWAARNGHEGVVKLLLGRKDVIPDRPDDEGRTPLLWAGYNGHKGVVELLVGREDVVPDRPDNKGRTAFSYAGGRGHEAVVKLLLGREGVIPDRPDNKGTTPFSHAAGRGHEGVVRLLLGRSGFIPDMLNKKGRTPLSYAAGWGHEGVVKLLLGREGVILNRPDNDGRTSFFYAAGRGHEGVVKLLLGREDVIPDMPDNKGRTPFSHAAGWGREGVVKLLLGRKDVNPDKPNKEGRTPFSYAAGRGHEVVAKLLLGRENVIPDRPDYEGRSPFSYAAGRGHEAMVELLLGRKDTNPDRLDIRDRTPFSYAARWGREGVVKLLLEREDVSPNIRDNKGRTPLSLAAGWGHEGVVRLLLGRKDVIPNTPDGGGRTPLSYAIKYRYAGVVQLLQLQNPTTSSAV